MHFFLSQNFDHHSFLEAENLSCFISQNVFSWDQETVVGRIKKSKMPTLFRERIFITNVHWPVPNGSPGSYGSYYSSDGSGLFGSYGTSGADDRKGLSIHYL